LPQSGKLQANFFFISVKCDLEEAVEEDEMDADLVLVGAMMVWSDFYRLWSRW
jgi:hypothetical protein